jgi:amidase
MINILNGHYRMKYCFFIFLLTSWHSLNAQHSLMNTDSSGNRFIHFIPTSFSNSFSLHIVPVCTVRQGDTVYTETIDAMGFDRNGIKRQKGSNPLTGPFYIENALPGDVLAITLHKVSLNRSYAYTTENFVFRSLPKPMTQKSQ